MWLRRKAKNRRLGREQVLDVKVRSSQVRAARTRLMAISLGAVFTTVFGLYLLYRAGDWALDYLVYENKAFAIQEIDVQTDGAIAVDQLRRWAGVKLEQNLLALDLARVKRDLELIPLVQSVSVERIPPHTLRIRITERKPIAQVNVPQPRANGGLELSVYQLDADGWVMLPLGAHQRATPPNPPDDPLPVLGGINASALQPGRRLAAPQVLAALQLLVAFEQSPMAGLVDSKWGGRLFAGSPGGENRAGKRSDLRPDGFRATTAAVAYHFRAWGRRRARRSPHSIWRSPTTFPFAGSSPARSRSCRRSQPNPYALRSNMFNASSIIVGLEIGTSKVCAVVGELSADGALNIVGLGQARSRGVRKGEIADPAQAEEDVRHAIVEAEQMADVEIRSVYLGVTGGHLRGFNNRGVHPVVSADREISHDDVQDVIKNAKAINLPAEDTVIHAMRQHFFVDGQDGITNPVGMLGARIEVDVHVVHGNVNRLQNAVRLVRATSLEVDDVVFNGIASSLALLTNEQKELGALVIDIGGGTTEYVVYANGIIRHTGVLAVGGDHVSNDLAYGLKVPLSRAEQFKLEHGSASSSDAAKGQTISLDQRTRPANSRPSTSNICAASCRCGWRRFSSLSARTSSRPACWITCGRACSSAAAALASRRSPSSPSRSCRCPCPSARPIPSAA